jgi:hypothetical protein
MKIIRVVFLLMVVGYLGFHVVKWAGRSFSVYGLSNQEVTHEGR